MGNPRQQVATGFVAIPALQSERQRYAQEQVASRQVAVGIGPRAFSQPHPRRSQTAVRPVGPVDVKQGVHVVETGRGVAGELVAR